MFATFPVVLLALLQSLGALLLLAPLPIAQFGIMLCKASATPVGKTALAVTSVFMLVLLVPPVLEVTSIRQQAKRQTHKEVELGVDTLNRRDVDTPVLSVVLTVYCLLMSFVLQKLGWVMSERERAKVNEATLLKQESRRRMFQEKAGAILHVKGLNAEYERLSSQQKAGGSPEGAGAAAQLQADLEAAREALEAAQEKQKEAEKRRAAAERNLDALKTQTKGLESEYDRLLESHSRLERRLAQHEPDSGGGRAGGKKDW